MKRGFTLVELLAVIVILAIILALAVPSISTVMESASKSSFASDAKMVLKAINYKMMEDESFNPNSVNETNLDDLLNLDNSNYESLTVKKINGIIYVTIVGKNKWNKLTVSGTKITTKVSDTVTSFVGGANKPVLVTGMTPIKWDSTENKWVDTTESDTGWYSYTTTDKKWANVRTTDGSMWVWIPRYIYRISSGWHTATTGSLDIQFSKGVDDNWNKAVIGDITVDESANASNAATNSNKYTNHPAFTFGDTELTGIWVAKFEASGTTSALDFKPNVVSLRSTSINNIFTGIRNMETNSRYGWGTTGKGIDTHLMKNTEWGAVSYLAQSTYGKNAKIWINNSSAYTTGCVGSTESASSYAGCEYAYSDATYGGQASTTGNIYGIYDMVGGAHEYTSSYVNNALASSVNTTSVYNANDKYKDVYIKDASDTGQTNFALAISHKGEAIYETSAIVSGLVSWNNASSSMPKADQPYFIRGGNHGNGTSADIFRYYIAAGNSDSTRGFRATLLINDSL